MSRGVARARAAPAPVPARPARITGGGMRAFPARPRVRARARRSASTSMPWARPLERALDFRRDGAAKRVEPRRVAVHDGRLRARVLARVSTAVQGARVPGSRRARRRSRSRRCGTAARCWTCPCGPGVILDLLARHSARSGKWERVVGLDYSARDGDAGARGVRRARDGGGGGRVRFAVRRRRSSTSCTRARGRIVGAI